MKKISVVAAAALLIMAILTPVGAEPPGQDDVTPTPPPSTGPMPTGEAASLPVGELVLNSEFDTSGPWMVGESEYLIAGILNGRYHLTTTRTPGLVISGMLDLDDFYAEFEVYPQVCPPAASFALAFRVDSETLDHYAFIMQCDGNYRVRIVRPTAGPGPLLAEGSIGSSLQIGSATPHTIGVLGWGDNFTLYFDGESIASFEDDTFEHGDIGILIQPERGTLAQMVIDVDNYRVWELNPETSRPTAAGERVELGVRLYDFGFEDSSGGWYLEGDEGISAVLEAGQLVIQGLGGTARYLSGAVSIADFYATADFYPQNCPEGGAFGIAFRAGPGVGYAFLAGCDATYRVERVTGQGLTATVLTGALPSAPFAGAGSHHKMGVLARGSQFTVYWDDVALQDFTDSSITQPGEIGFAFVSSIEQLTVAADNLRVWILAAPVSPEVAPEVSTAPPVEVDRLLYSYDFDAPRGWFTGETETGGSARLENGRYVVEVTNQPNVFWSGAIDLSDFYAQVEVYPVDCREHAAFALAVRLDPDPVPSEMLFLVECSGAYRVRTLAGDQAGEILLSGVVPAPQDQADQVHVMGVLAQGDWYTVFWDGEVLGTAVDDTYRHGDIGFFVKPSPVTLDGATVAFDNLRVWSLPEGGVEVPAPEVAPTPTETPVGSESGEGETPPQETPVG